MGRRDGDDRPPVELWGADADPSPPDVQRLEVHGGRSLRRPLLVGAAVAAVIVTGLLIGGDDKSPDPSAATPHTTDSRPSSVTRPSTTTTSTTSTIAAGPVFGVPVGGGIIVNTSGSRWRWIDLGTGEQRDVSFQPSTTGEVLPVRGGVVIVQDGAEFVPLPEGDHVRLGPAGSVLASGDPDAVWLLRPLDPNGRGIRAQLVDLRGAPRGKEVVVPNGYPAGGARSGVLIGSAGRLYRADASGVHPLIAGDVLAAGGDRAVVYTCDDELQCSLVTLDVATGRTTRLGTETTWGIAAFVSETGEVALQSYEGDRTLVLFDAAGTELAAVGIGPGAQLQGPVSWLPGDLGLLVQSDDGILRVVATPAGLVVEPIPALAGLRGDQVLVIPR